MANLGIALGAGVDEFNNQRRMAQQDELAAQQKEQFGWAKTAQAQHQAVKAAQAKVLSDAEELRKRYAAGDVIGVTKHLSERNNGSDWNGNLQSDVVQGLDGKVHVIGYKDGVRDGANAQRQEVTPQFFEQALNHNIAYEMAKADPQNFIKNYGDIRKTEQGDEHNAIARTSAANSKEAWDADRTSKDANFKTELEFRAEQTRREIAARQAAAGLVASTQEKRWTREDNRLAAADAAAIARAEVEQTRYDQGVRDKHAETVKRSFATEAGKYFDGKGADKKAEAEIAGYAGQFEQKKGQSSESYAAQVVSNWNLERSLAEQGKNWLLPNAKPWGGKNKTQWEHVPSLKGPDYDTFKNKDGGQTVDMGFVKSLPPDQATEFLGRVTTSKGSPVDMGSRLQEKAPEPEAKKPANGNRGLYKPPANQWKSDYVPKDDPVKIPGGLSKLSSGTTLEDMQKKVLGQGRRHIYPNTDN